MFVTTLPGTAEGWVPSKGIMIFKNSLPTNPTTFVHKWGHTRYLGHRHDTPDVDQVYNDGTGSPEDERAIMYRFSDEGRCEVTVSSDPICNKLSMFEPKLI